ncbi:eukaryotic membrane protein family-domain-containing protein [Multifurca ochricompacta]|uniref:Eukaryotic membrane protein family-domain-containing protein n=1 Tax=Multifurca ochricompacta TaxID=376703 RepID=A0AAD4QN69_9AGAM|nr:eukaryotic membrane protein family-domain-containing protein [Multifurca ochricompacta]
MHTCGVQPQHEPSSMPRRVSNSSNQSQSAHATTSDTNYPRVQNLRPRRRRHRTTSTSNGNDIPSVLLRASMRRLSDPPLVLQDSRIFRAPSPSEDGPLLTYASLPPTPITSSPPPPASVESVTNCKQNNLIEELLETDFDSHQELKWERVSNFLSIPLAIEKIISFGFILCFDSFLYTFTIQPIRFTLALWRLFISAITNSKAPLPSSQKADILRTLLLTVSILILIPLTDASKIYHSIRGQDTIKLYVIFNALEIADRLCASIGQDILDCLFSRSTLLLLSRRLPVTTHTIRPVVFFLLATLYTVTHALVMVYQMLCLNVAINSYDNALLSLLMSNQFVEIKGSVFKKFEKDNLFQITCADIVERFTLGLMLFFVAFRNLIELSGSEFDFSGGMFLPKSFGWIGGSVLWTISYVACSYVMLSETLVDWLKHAFITKFNHIRPSVYERYKDVLCRDLASGSRLSARKHSYIDQSPVVARRLGFSSLPLAVLTILIGTQAVTLIVSPASPSLASALYERSAGVAWRPGLFLPFQWWTVEGWQELFAARLDWELGSHWVKWGIIGFTFWICFVLIKVIMGVNLVSYAIRRRAGMEAREIADVVNDFGRDPIGEGQEERKYNRELKDILDNGRDDAVPVSEIGERGSGEKRVVVDSSRGESGKQKRPKLEELTRFTMVKRIW